MFGEILDALLGTRDEFPNKVSIEMGKRIRAAREEINMTQAELAKAVIKRRPSISDMESGKMFPDIMTLLMMSQVLDKPFFYFIPEHLIMKKHTPQLSTQEQELLILFRELNEAQKKLVVAQVKAVAELTEENTDTKKIG